MGMLELILQDAEHAQFLLKSTGAEHVISLHCRMRGNRLVIGTSHAAKS